MAKPEIIKIDDTEYIRKDSISNKAPELDGMEYCIVRTYSAGVFAGYIESRKGKETTIKQARRIWYWAGAASLSQLAVDGTSQPNECKFPCEVEKIIVTETIEILPCTEKAMKSIREVEEWRK